MRYRSLEGFIASVSPFNFTAIAGNLAYTPAMMVNHDFTKKIHRKRKFTHPTSLSREMVSFGNPVTQPLCPTTSFIRFFGTPGSPMVWLILYPQMVPFLAKPLLLTQNWRLLISRDLCRKFEFSWKFKFFVKLTLFLQHFSMVVEGRWPKLTKIHWFSQIGWRMWRQKLSFCPHFCRCWICCQINCSIGFWIPRPKMLGLLQNVCSWITLASGKNSNIFTKSQKSLKNSWN